MPTLPAENVNNDRAPKRVVTTTGDRGPSGGNHVINVATGRLVYNQPIVVNDASVSSSL